MDYYSVQEFQEKSKSIFNSIAQFKSKITAVEKPETLFPESPGNEAVIKTDTMHGVDIVKALNKYPDLISHLSTESEDKAFAYNNAYFNTGLVIPVEEDGIIHLSVESNANTVSVIRNLFVIGENKKCSIICRVFGTGKVNIVNLVIAKQGSDCKFGMVNDAAEGSILFNRGEVKKDARIDFSIVHFGSKPIHAITENHLKGLNSYGEIIDVYHCATIMELGSKLYCKAKNNRGMILSKGLVKDAGEVTFEGYAKIEKHAENADIFVGNHAIILNKGARANLIPNLEIENNNVRAGHASSVHQFDEEKLFYMMARGFSEEQSRKLLIEGFLFSAIDKIAIPEIREVIEKRI